MYLINLFLKDRGQRIMLTNIFDPTKRSVVLDRFESFKPHQSRKYDFNDGFDEEMDRLNSLFYDMMGKYFDMERKYKKKKLALSELDEKMKEVSDELAALRGQSPGDIGKRIKKLKHCIQIGKEEIERLTKKKTKLEHKRDTGEPFEFDTTFDWNQDTEDLSGIHVETEGSRATRVQTSEAIVKLVSVHPRVYAVDYFEIYDNEACYEVVVGCLANGMFVPFVKSTTLHENGFGTTIYDVKDLPEYQLAAREGNIHFRFTGAFNYTGIAGFSLKYSALRRPSEEECNRLTREIVACDNDLVAEKRVLSRRKLAKKDLQNLQPDIEKKESEYAEALSKQADAQTDLNKLALDLRVNRDFFFQMQQLIREYNLVSTAQESIRERFREFSAIDLVRPSWLRDDASQSQGDYTRNRHHTFYNNPQGESRDEGPNNHHRCEI